MAHDRIHALSHLPVGDDPIVATVHFVQVATQSSPDTVLVACADLHFHVAADAVYVFDLEVLYDGSTTGDIKFDLTTPASPTSFVWDYIGAGLASGSSPASASTEARSGSQTGSAGAVGAGTTMALRIKGRLANGPNAGTVAFRFAQAAASGVATRVLAGSFGKAERVA